MSMRTVLSPEQYGFVLDSLSEGVCTVDRTWAITSFNRSAQALTGVSVEEALGLSFGDLFHCEVCECASLLFARHVHRRDAAGREHPSGRSTGRRIPVSLNAAPLRDGRGETVGLVASFPRQPSPRDAAQRVAPRNSHGTTL
jgi:PAS domain S-box-containing protein